MALRGLAATILLVLFLPACTDSTDSTDADELAQLVARARPVWADYGEGMKAALGATPVARWAGRPIAADVTDRRVTVEFELDAPWREYSFGMPILIRDPLGRVHDPVSYSDGTYVFELDGFAPGAVIAWIEIRFPPNEERRIAFDHDGEWRAAGH